jgi:phosphatidylinositol glycan class M
MSDDQPSTPTTIFRAGNVFPTAIALRVFLFAYGLFQDANAPMKYTDIDYYVFTDAARFVAQGQSPYERETYRYTPLLAWILVPTSWNEDWFSFGKILFAAADILTGWLIVRILRQQRGITEDKATVLACVWLINPMVATISTRGSSEGLLGVTMMLMLWLITQRRIGLAAIVLGFAVHFKIYPFIYAASLFWWLGSPMTSPESRTITAVFKDFFNTDRVNLTVISLATFTALNMIMYNM